MMVRGLSLFPGRLPPGPLIQRSGLMGQMVARSVQSPCAYPRCAVRIDPNIGRSQVGHRTHVSRADRIGAVADLTGAAATGSLLNRSNNDPGIMRSTLVGVSAGGEVWATLGLISTQRRTATTRQGPGVIGEHPG